MDFIVSRKDFVALSGHVAELEWKDRFRINMFPDGDLPNYRYEDYRQNARKAPFNFKNLEVYYLDKADLRLTKILAGRDMDLKHIGIIAPTPEIVPLDELMDRYRKVIPAKGREKEIKSRFESFVEKFYKTKLYKNFHFAQSIVDLAPLSH